MRSPNSRPSRTTPLIVLGACVLIGIVAGILQNRHSPLLAPVSAILYPFQTTSSRIQGWTASNWNALFRGRVLEKETVRLRAENAALKQANEKLANAESEAARLRDVLHYQAGQKNVQTIAAPVIAWLPSRSFDTLTIGAGTRSGVRQKSVVRTPAGLVGQVIEAAPLSSNVLLLTDVQSGVGGLVKRSGKTKSDGIVQGTGRGRLLEMVDLKHEDDVVKGDVVVSSGYGGVIPPGLPIGIVQSVSEDTTHYLKVALIAPFAPPPGDLRDVLIIAPQNADAPDAIPLPLPKTTPTPAPTPKPTPSPTTAAPPPRGSRSQPPR